MGNGRGLIPDSADLIGAILDADPREQLRRRLHAAGQVDALVGDRADVRVGYDAEGQPLVLHGVPVQAGFQPAVGDWVRLVYPNDDPSAALVEGPTVTQSTDPPGGGVPSVVDQTQVKPDAIESDAYTAPPGHLRDNLDHLRAVVKAMKGTAAWITTPPATLQEARDHIDNLSNPHHTTLEQARTAGSVLQGGFSFAAGVVGFIAGAADQAARFGFASANGPQWGVLGPSAGANPGRLFARFGGGAAIGDLAFLWNDGAADAQVGQASRQGGWGFGSAYAAPAVDGGVVCAGVAAGGGTPVAGAYLGNTVTPPATLAAGDFASGDGAGIVQWDASAQALIFRATGTTTDAQVGRGAADRLDVGKSGAADGLTVWGAINCGAQLDASAGRITANTIIASRGGTLWAARFLTDLSGRRNWGLITEATSTGDLTIQESSANNTNPSVVRAQMQSGGNFVLPVSLVVAAAAGTAATSGYTQDFRGASQHLLASATAYASDWKASGDSNLRFRVRADGRHEWGPGNAATDVLLYRDQVSVLRTESHVQADQSLYLGRAWESGNSKQGTIRLTRATGALSNALLFLRGNVSGDSGERMVIGDDRIFFGAGGTVPGPGGSDVGLLLTVSGGSTYADYYSPGGHRINNSDVQLMSGVDVFPNADNDVQVGFRSAPGVGAYRATKALVTHRLELRDQRASSQQGDFQFVDTSVSSQTPGTTFHDFGGGKTLKYTGLWINVNGTVYAIPAIADTGVTPPGGPSVPQ